MSTYIILIVLVEAWQINVIVASVIGYIVGIVVNYTLNYGFTFQSKLHHHILVPRFVMVMMVGLLLNTGIMFAGVNWFRINYVLAQLAAIALVLIWSYTANRLWVFTN
jgi:putative flippase GtrA